MAPPENPVELPEVDPPENPVEIPGVSPKNEVDDNIVRTLFTSDYDSENESDKKYEDTDTCTQQRQRVMQPEAMLPMMRNVYNLCPRKKNEYVKEYIDRLIFFAQVGNDLNEDKFSFFQHKEIEYTEEKIDYATVIEYAFTK